MFTDFYQFMRVGMTVAATGVGLQITTDKPEPKPIINDSGQKEYIQDLSMVEKSIERVTKVIENIDAKVLSRFFTAVRVKSKEVNVEYVKERNKLEATDSMEDLQLPEVRVQPKEVVSAKGERISSTIMR